VGCSITYLATDPAEEAVVSLEAALAGFQHARVQRWDSRVAEDDRAPAAGAFDVIVGACALSFGGLDQGAIDRIAARLAPGGILLTVEPEPNPVVDFLFGQNPRWWRPTPDTKEPASPSAMRRAGARSLRRQVSKCGRRGGWAPIRGG
jgi:hypothetical protein